MFDSCISLVEAPILPATTLASSCYNSMFLGCTSLVDAPELPATKLTYGCYKNMFRGCKSLMNAPILPATTLNQSCYSYMFFGCTSLVDAPELPATVLVKQCYEYMFYNCVNLKYVKILATDVFSLDYLSNWLYGVSSTGSFIMHQDAEWDFRGSGVPYEWGIYRYKQVVIYIGSTDTSYWVYQDKWENVINNGELGTRFAINNGIVVYADDSGIYQPILVGSREVKSTDITISGYTYNISV